MKKGLSQETLKIIACVTMLIDHIGAALVIPSVGSAGYFTTAWVHVIMRCIGRISFPIFCFLLAEGAYHTQNPKKYALRLAVGMVLSEIPFDMVFFGGMTWDHQSVMVTLLLGLGMIEAMKRSSHLWKLLWIIPFYIAAEWLHTDYAGEGILIIAVFALSKGMKYEKLVRLAAMVLVLWDNMGFYHWGLEAPIYYNRWRTLAAVPIFCYDGRKLTKNKTLQTAFYLFYPVHLAVLLLIRWIL